jgi:hypothetical protein
LATKHTPTWRYTMMQYWAVEPNHCHPAGV